MLLSVLTQHVHGLRKAACCSTVPWLLGHIPQLQHPTATRPAQRVPAFKVTFRRHPLEAGCPFNPHSTSGQVQTGSSRSAHQAVGTSNSTLALRKDPYTFPEDEVPLHSYGAGIMTASLGGYLRLGMRGPSPPAAQAGLRGSHGGDHQKLLQLSALLSPAPAADPCQQREGGRGW